MKLFSHTKRLYHTLKYLTFTQLYYRLYYVLRTKFRCILNFAYALEKPSHSRSLILQSSIPSYMTFYNESFTFLNKTYTLDAEGIDWNYEKYGKLWTYNLTYFDYLLQEDMRRQKGLELIYDFIDKIDSVSDGLMPFPISLRGINWIKFLSNHEIKNQQIDDSLYAQYYILVDTLEYHILGNHLLENGFSLLFGAYYFQDDTLYKKANEILGSELHEQVLEDGGHYELSPMYHQIMLYRILDCINLIQNNPWKKDGLYVLLVQKAQIMLSWLAMMTFSDGSIPLFNDSTNKIAPTTDQLNSYASQLKIYPRKVALGSSGYRRFDAIHYEIIVDVGNIGPDYIPGHAHSDTFNFEFYIAGKPVIVDTGVSTYETNERRQIERSTSSHNTVLVNNKEQSEVWGGFRVAKRAKIVHLRESEEKITAVHDGYAPNGILHQREFIMNEDSIEIIDTIDTKNEHRAVAYIHFYPDINVYLEDNILHNTLFSFKATGEIVLEEYEYSPQFNTKIKAQCAKIAFENRLKIDLVLKI